MKSTLLNQFCIIIIILINLQANGQTTISMCKQGYEWTTVSVSNVGKIVYQYYYQKDTIINGTLYSKVTGTSDYLIRESDGKIYISWIGGDYLGEEYTKEFLRYDFNLTLNDTFNIVYPGPDYLAGPEKMVVIDVDSVVLEDSEKRKRITLDMLGTGYDENMVWIEGIGSNYGFDYNTHFSTSVPLYLSYFANSGMLKYKGPYYNFGGCAINQITELEKSKEDLIDQVYIYPNPTYSMLNIRSSNVNVLTVNIFDQIGSLRYSKSGNKTNSGFYQIDISDLQSGFYMVELLDKSKKITCKTIIKE